MLEASKPIDFPAFVRQIPHQHLLDEISWLHALREIIENFLVAPSIFSAQHGAGPSRSRTSGGIVNISAVVFLVMDYSDTKREQEQQERP
jgi:hypothetical protein